MRETIKPWKWKSEYGTAQVITTADHYDKFLKLLERPRILLDTETTSLENDRELRLVQVGWGGKVWLLDPEIHKPLIVQFMRSDKIFVAHNSPFDLLTLGTWRWPLDWEKAYKWATDKALNGQVIDTMVTEQFVKSEQRVKGLARIAQEEGVHNLYESEWNEEAASLGHSEDNKYAAVSVNNECWLRYSAHDLFQLQAAYERNKSRHMDKAVQVEVGAAILYDILRHRGMCIDYNTGENLYKELTKTKAKVMKKLTEVGIEKAGSADQVADALIDNGAKLTAKTPSGKYQMDKHILNGIEKPKRAALVAKQVIRARSLQKDMSSIINLAENSSEGRVHPNLWRIGAVTGRSSCSNPNLQQLNKHTGDSRVRGILMAEEGHLTGSVDFDGIEVRVIADLAHDDTLCAKLLKGADIHGELAEEAGISRQKAKIGIFAMLYGASTKAIASQAEMDHEQALGLQQAWNELYPDVADASREWIEEAEFTGHIRLPNGWTPHVGHYAGELAAYRAVNYMVQGMAAFLFRQAAVQLAQAGLWKHVRMVVHDEFVLSLPEDKAYKLIEKIRKTAEIKTENMIYTCGGEVYGRHWGEVHERR